MGSLWSDGKSLVAEVYACCDLAASHAEIFTDRGLPILGVLIAFIPGLLCRLARGARIARSVLGLGDENFDHPVRRPRVFDTGVQAIRHALVHRRLECVHDRNARADLGVLAEVVDDLLDLFLALLRHREAPEGLHAPDDLVGVAGCRRRACRLAKGVVGKRKGRQYRDDHEQRARPHTLQHGDQPIYPTPRLPSLLRTIIHTSTEHLKYDSWHRSVARLQHRSSSV